MSWRNQAKNTHLKNVTAFFLKRVQGALAPIQRAMRAAGALINVRHLDDVTVSAPRCGGSEYRTWDMRGGFPYPVCSEWTRCNATLVHVPANTRPITDAEAAAAAPGGSGQGGSDGGDGEDGSGSGGDMLEGDDAPYNDDDPYGYGPGTGTGAGGGTGPSPSPNDPTLVTPTPYVDDPSAPQMYVSRENSGSRFRAEGVFLGFVRLTTRTIHPHGAHVPGGGGGVGVGVGGGEPKSN